MIRGGTPHFDYVAGQCAAGLASAAQETGVPVAFGVLTTDTIEQAIERAGTKAGNKGADAALCALELANLLRRLEAEMSPSAGSCRASAQRVAQVRAAGALSAAARRRTSCTELRSSTRPKKASARATPNISTSCSGGVTARCASSTSDCGHSSTGRSNSLDPIERAALWIGLYELSFRLEIPYRVVLNESVELAKRFGATDGHKYVNAILDRAARELRAGGAGRTARRRAALGA